MRFTSTANYFMLFQDCAILVTNEQLPFWKYFRTNGHFTKNYAVGDGIQSSLQLLTEMFLIE